MAMMAAAQNQPGIGPGIGIYCDYDVLRTLKVPHAIRGRIVEDAGADGEDNIRYIGEYSNGQEQLRMVPGTLTALCQWGLPEGYISDEVFGQIYDYHSETWKRGLNQDKMTAVDEDDKTDPKGNLILILYDDIQTRQGIRGFALCNVNVRERNMTLLVLGATKPTVDLRGKSFARGGMLLRLVQYLGSDLNYISLYALETVITLYAHFGWKFMDPDRCNITSDQENMLDRKNAQNISELKQLYKKVYPAEPNEKILTNMLRTKFGRYAKNFHTFVRTGQNKDDDGSFAAAEEGRENGYIMILCKRDNPYSDTYSDTYVPPPAAETKKRKRGGNKDIINVDRLFPIDAVYFIQSKKRKREGGGKRRTKKRALRKKHRGRKTKGKKKKNKKWCKSTKAWCKYTKKNNCKKGLWKKKTKLGRASRRWCRSTKRWCKVRKTVCKKRR